MRFIFVAELTKNTGQTTLEGGEGGTLGVVTRRKLKKVITFLEDDDKKGHQFYGRKKWVTR